MYKEVLFVKLSRVTSYNERRHQLKIGYTFTLAFIMNPIRVSGYPSETNDVFCKINGTRNSSAYCATSPQMEYSLFYYAMFALRRNYVVRNSSDGQAINLPSESPGGYFKDLATGRIDVMDPDYIPMPYATTNLSMISAPLLWDQEVFFFNNDALTTTTDFSFFDIIPPLVLVLLMFLLGYRVCAIENRLRAYFAGFPIYLLFSGFVFFYRLWFTKVTLRLILRRYQFPCTSYCSLVEYLTTADPAPQLCVDEEFDLMSLVESCDQPHCSDLGRLFALSPPNLTKRGRDLQNCVQSARGNIGLSWRNDLMAYMNFFHDITVVAIDDPFVIIPFMVSYVSKLSPLAVNLTRAYLMVVEAGFNLKTVEKLERDYHALTSRRPTSPTIPHVYALRALTAGLSITLTLAICQNVRWRVLRNA